MFGVGILSSLPNASSHYFYPFLCYVPPLSILSHPPFSLILSLFCLSTLFTELRDYNLSRRLNFKCTWLGRRINGQPLGGGRHKFRVSFFFVDTHCLEHKKNNPYFTFNRSIMWTIFPIGKILLHGCCAFVRSGRTCSSEDDVILLEEMEIY